MKQNSSQKPEIVGSDLKDKIKDFTIYLASEKRYSKHTVSAYGIDILKFLEFLHSHLGEEITLETIAKMELADLRAWLSNRYDRSLKFTSTKRAISAISSFVNFCKKEKGFSSEAILNIKRPKTPQWLPRAASEDDVIKISDEISKWQKEVWIHKRDKALTLLIYGTGLRISEALSLKRKNFGERDFVVVKGKRNKERMVPILPKVFDAISDYLKSCKHVIMPDYPLFVSNTGKEYSPRIFQKNIQTTRRILNLDEFITPHSLRHSCATHLLQHGGDIRSIQKLLGHQALSTTQRYTNVADNQLLTSYLDAKRKG